MKTLFGFAILCLVSASVFAQPRTDNHFLAKKVEIMLPLGDKINEPMASAESQLYLPSENVHEGNFANTRGVVYALLAGLERGDYVGYQPDNLKKEQSFMALKQDLQARAADFKANAAEPVDSWEDCDCEETDGPNDDFNEDFTLENEVSTEPNLANAGNKELFFPLGTAVKIIGNEIFDKNTASARFVPEYVELYYIDPAGVLRDKPVVAFKYDDIKYALDATQWKNRFNDAEHRSLKEIFELRLYSGYFISVSDVNMASLDESAKRADQIRENEHHLWEN